MNNVTHAQGSTSIVVAQIGVVLIATILSSKFSNTSFDKMSFILEAASDISRA